MDEFIARLNIEHLQRKLSEETRRDKAAMIAGLLAEEMEKLALIGVSKDKVKKA